MPRLCCRSSIPPGHCPGMGVLWKVMRLHDLGLLTPDLPGVLEVADQLFFLGVHADHWLPRRLMHHPLGVQMLELLVPLRMLRAGVLHAVCAQAVAVRPQQAANDGLTDEMTALIQLLANIAQAAIEPFLI